MRSSGWFGIWIVEIGHFPFGEMGFWVLHRIHETKKEESWGLIAEGFEIGSILFC